jgi:glycine betaine/proline transport system permease protein
MSEVIPLGAWVDHGVHYLLDHDAKTFDSIGKVIEMACKRCRCGR